MNDSTKAVLELMRVYDGACAKTFALNDIYRYSARIHDLRNQGYRIGARPCTSPLHTHTHRINEYYLEGL